LAGRVAAGELGLDGDEQAARDVHGGPQMAVLAYAMSHYAAWRTEPGLAEMGPGAFGENLAWDGVDETSVCIGDVWENEHVAFEVSQPRGPCAAISRWWNAPTLLARATETARVGWYLRVTREGDVGRGDTLTLSARPQPLWTIARVFRARISAEAAAVDAHSLSVLPELSPEWRAMFAEKAARLS
jgi:MOSC domain-containing protein YiiM